VNFCNLVPMGSNCNAYKNDANIVYQNYITGERRFVWYPYSWFASTIKMIPVLKPSFTNPKGTWSVLITGSNATEEAKINTWRAVFNIDTQFSAAFNHYFKVFLADFVRKNNLYGERLTLAGFKQKLNNYVTNGVGDVRYETMARLKQAWAEYYMSAAPDPECALIIQAVLSVPRLHRP
jgi:hypothetical protein